MLVGCADYHFHALGPDGTHLWGFRTGGRVYSSPVPDGDEVYFGSDDGCLYKVDVQSGVLIWDFKTGDCIRSAPALADGRVYVASWDGKLYAVAAETGLPVWNAPIAKYTSASPAVWKGRVYIGDEEGRAHCFDAATGKPLWQHELGGYISMCPVVSVADDGATGGVFFASEQGHVALMDPDGKIMWHRKLESAIPGQPVATQTQLLVPTAQGLLALRRRDGERDARFTPPRTGKLVSVLPYRDYLCVEYASGRNGAAMVVGDVAVADLPDSLPGWLVLSGQPNKNRIGRMRLNLGARGDRIDVPNGRSPAWGRWFAFPRPTVKGAMPLKVEFSGKAVYGGNDELRISGTDGPWLYTSWLHGQGKLVLKLGPAGGSQAEQTRYTVRLHFAEPEDIKLGRRVFDVAIQGEQALKGFDIVKAAGGPGRAIVKEFKDVQVGRELSIELTSTGPDSSVEPLICGVEVEAQ